MITDHEKMLSEIFSVSEELYKDIITLDVLSGIEIDKAKKEFSVDSKREIDKLRKKHHIHTEDGKIVMPKFLGFIAKSKGYYDSSRKSYKYHKSSMDYVEAELAKLRFPRRSQYTELADLIREDVIGEAPDNRHARQSILNKIDEAKAELIRVREMSTLTKEEKRRVVGEIIEARDNYMSNLAPNVNTVKSLIRIIEKKEYLKYRHSLFNMLFNSGNVNFYNMIEASREQIKEIEPSDDGDIDIYGYKYRYKT